MRRERKLKMIEREFIFTYIVADLGKYVRSSIKTFTMVNKIFATKNKLLWFDKLLGAENINTCLYCIRIEK